MVKPDTIIEKKFEVANLEALVGTAIQDESDGSQTVKQLFTIKRDNDGQSDIDFKTELTRNEIIDHTVVDFITETLELKDLTTDFVLKGLTNKLKRLMVSKERKGRDEAVSIFRNERENQGGNGFLSNLFKPKE